MTTTANTLHTAAGGFDPTAYEYVTAIDTGETEGFSHSVADGEAYERLLTSPSSTYSRRGACDHCGARLRYVAILEHKPTGDYVAVGETCLSHRVALASKADFDALRKASAEARAEHRIKTLRTEFLAEYPDLEAILWPVPSEWTGKPADIAHDLNRSLRRNGTLSVAQVGLARKLAGWIADNAKRDADRVAEHEAAEDCPTGRIEILGTVVSVKLHEGDYGDTWKMTVKADGGYLVWTTVPRSIGDEIGYNVSISEALKGRRVRFTATVTPSDTDAKFGFAKRPTKAALLEEAAV